MPTITQLEYIVAVDTLRHFGLAAKQCFVTQPTLSMQIKKAEEELGVIIFDRSKQPVLPTDVGIELIKQGRVILREKQRLEQIIADFQENVSGQLRIGIIPTLAPYLLPLFVGDFVRDYPKLNLKVKELTTQQIIQSLQNDSIDVGILVTPLNDPMLKEHVLFYEPIKAYVHPSHSLYGQQSISIQDLQQQSFWLLSQGHCFRDQVVNLCALNQQKNLPFEYESNSLEGLQRLVDKEGGFTLIPELATLPKKQHIQEIEAPKPLREVSLVYVRNFAKRKVLQLLSDSIKAAVPPHMLEAAPGHIVEWR